MQNVHITYELGTGGAVKKISGAVELGAMTGTVRNSSSGRVTLWTEKGRIEINAAMIVRVDFVEDPAPPSLQK